MGLEVLIDTEKQEFCFVNATTGFVHGPVMTAFDVCHPEYESIECMAEEFQAFLGEDPRLMKVEDIQCKWFEFTKLGDDWMQYRLLEEDEDEG